MTKKDYIVIANVIRTTSHSVDTSADVTLLHDVATRFAEMAVRDNARFDRDRFLIACGLQAKR